MPHIEGGEGAGEEKEESESDAALAPAGTGDVGAEPRDDVEDALAWFIEAAQAAAFRAARHDALEEELAAGLASGLTAREHMLDLIRLTRERLLPELDSDLSLVLSVMLAEISDWVAEYDRD